MFYQQFVHPHPLSLSSHLPSCFFFTLLCFFGFLWFHCGAIVPTWQITKKYLKMILNTSTYRPRPPPHPRHTSVCQTEQTICTKKKTTIHHHWLTAPHPPFSLYPPIISKDQSTVVVNWPLYKPRSPSSSFWPGLPWLFTHHHPYSCYFSTCRRDASKCTHAHTHTTPTTHRWMYSLRN